MCATGLLTSNPTASESEIVEGLDGNLCRCTGYVNIVAAIKDAAAVIQAGTGHTARSGASK